MDKSTRRLPPGPKVHFLLDNLLEFFFFLIIRPPPTSPLFPHTPLFRSLVLSGGGPAQPQQGGAPRLGIDRTTMVALADEREAGGLVGRGAAPGDRRKRLVTLTSSPA